MSTGGEKTVFLAWKQLSRRTELLAKALGIEIWFFPDRTLYLKAAINSLRLILNRKPSVMIIQLPQGPLLLMALIVKILMKIKIVADIHTGFLFARNWKGYLLNIPFVNFLYFADEVIIHNNHVMKLLPKEVRHKTSIVYDPWYFLDIKEEKVKKDEKYVVFPASFAPDEPIEEIIKSVNKIDLNIKLYITGNWRKKPKIKKLESDKIIFTGYLPYKKYDELIIKSNGIIAGTTQEYTALMSAWEAVANAKPLALSKTATLMSIFKEYAVFYNWKNEDSIKKAIINILKDNPKISEREKMRKYVTKSVNELKRKIEIIGS